MRRYEVVFVLAPTMTDEAVEQLVQTYSSTASEMGAVVLNIDRWGRRPLAFPVQKFSDGIYVVLTLEEPAAQAVKELERRFKVTDSVIRFLSVRIDEDLKRAEKFRASRATQKQKTRKPRSKGSEEPFGDLLDLPCLQVPQAPVEAGEPVGRRLGPEPDRRHVVSVQPFREGEDDGVPGLEEPVPVEHLVPCDTEEKHPGRLLRRLRGEEGVQGPDALPEKGVAMRIHGGPLVHPGQFEQQQLYLRVGRRYGSSLHFHPDAPLPAGRRLRIYRIPGWKISVGITDGTSPGEKIPGFPRATGSSRP